jgi:hypothetical protein
VLVDGADQKGVSHATVALPRRVRVRNVALALAVIPGLLYGIAWLVLGFSEMGGLARDLGVRGLGFFLAAAACNCAWHLAKDSRVGQSFLAYIASFVTVFVLILTLTS